MIDISWQEQALCGPIQRNYDPWFADDEEDQLVARVVCMSCPVRAHCLMHSLVNGFEFGIFAGLNYEERKPLRQNLLQQLDTESVARLEHSYLVVLPGENIPTSSVDAKYSRRQQRAELCYDQLMQMQPNDLPNTLYEKYMEVLRAVLRNPTGTGAQLGKAIGRSTAMFNQRLRECFQFFGLDLSLL